MRPPNDAMGIPSRRFHDPLIADQAYSILFIPKIDELPISLQLLHHLYFEAALEVLFPSGIIRIGFSAHFGMSLNWGQAEIVQPHCLWLCVSSLDSSAKYPVPVILGAKVFLSYPVTGSVWMPSSRPTPQYPKDEMIH